MANSYKTTTNLWVVDEIGLLNVRGVTVERVVYFPSTAGDDLILTDKNDNEAIVLKAGASDISGVHLSFGDVAGRKMPSLKVGTIDGGTAYIYLIKEEY